MKKTILQSNYIDINKGSMGVNLEMAINKKGKMKVGIKSKRKLPISASGKKQIELMGNAYVKMAQEELRKQANVLGMATFANRFPLISIAVQDPNLYLANQLILFIQGLRTKNYRGTMAFIDAAFKAKEGSFPDPLPAPIKRKLKPAKYKKWGRDCSKILLTVTKKLGRGDLKKDLFSSISNKSMHKMIKLTTEAAKFYTEQAMR